MKANELMIGDWIFSDSTKTKVTGNIINDIVHDEPYFNEKNTFPIPLTKEIILNNGFELGEYHTYNYRDLYLFLHYEVTEDEHIIKYFTLCGTRIQIDYVHELQHLLRICGYNELADNFKI